MRHAFRISSTPVRNVLVCCAFLLVLCLLRYLDTWHGWNVALLLPFPALPGLFLSTFYLAIIWANRNLFRSEAGGFADWVMRAIVSAVLVPVYLPVVVVLAALFNVAIGGGFFDAIHQPMVGPYILIAVDSDEQLVVAYDRGDGFSIGRIGPVVTDAGWNSAYIVAAVRPPGKRQTASSYYYLEIQRDSEWGDQFQAVTGPLSQAEFDLAKRRLDLPEFSRSFPQLR
jgi:hypothetical protein